MKAKKPVLGLLALGLIAYSGTVAYLQHYDHATAPQLPAASPIRSVATALTAFKVFAEARCDYCHIPGTELPFYAHVPGASQLMQHDVAEGLKHFRFAPVLAALEAGKPVAEEPLARIEEVIAQHRMPPLRYTMMHWHAHLDDTQRQAVLNWIDATRRQNYAGPGVAPALAAEPIQPLPAGRPVDAKQVALGDKLFFDKRLSGDGTLNCASCHALQHGGVDGLVTATGIHGQKGPINVPTVYNSAFNHWQFWNGRAADLAAQAAGPILNPVEMGSPNWASVIAKLETDPSYPAEFAAAFGPGPINQQKITAAIAAYEATLITPDSRFDQYLKGDAKALTAQERRGYQRFKAIGCAGCHNGKAAGGTAMEVFGLEGDYFADRGGPLTEADLGRETVTHEAIDKERFKVPTLRNIELTAPYFHDGSAKTLAKAVQVMAKYQTPAGRLSDRDVADIVAFLKTLTGKYQGQPLSPSAEKPAGQAN